MYFMLKYPLKCSEVCFEVQRSAYFAALGLHCRRTWVLTYLGLSVFGKGRDMETMSDHQMLSRDCVPFHYFNSKTFQCLCHSIECLMQVLSHFHWKFRNEDKQDIVLLHVKRHPDP